MANVIVGLFLGILFGLFIGYIIAKQIISQTKFGDREKALNAKWKQKHAELQKEYEVKLEKVNTNLEKSGEQKKTELEELKRKYEIKLEKTQNELNVRYIKDIEELKKLFKNKEKQIKKKSVSSSRRVLVGKFIEKFVPFLESVKYNPSDMQFLGQPIDYIVFEGLSNNKITNIKFLEVKTGKSRLTKRERSLRDSIKNKKVSWEEVRVDTKSKETPDEEIATDETCIKKIYDSIDSKINKAKKELQDKKTSKDPESEEDSDDSAEEDWAGRYDMTCPWCKREFTLELDENDNPEEGIDIACPLCKKGMVLDAEDFWE